MSVWVDPNLLSLAGVGLASDLDAPGGRHLRWFFGAPLGFPRGGIRLRRHASKVLAVWDSVTAPDPLIRTQWLSQADLARARAVVSTAGSPSPRAAGSPTRESRAARARSCASTPLR